MRKLDRMLAAAAIVGAASAVQVSNEALAHPGDVHPWFEHERARTDGGPALVSEASPSQQAEGRGERMRSAGQTLPLAQGARDCLPEEPKRSGEARSRRGDCDSAANDNRPAAQAGGVK